MRRGAGGCNSSVGKGSGGEGRRKRVKCILNKKRNFTVTLFDHISKNI